LQRRFRQIGENYIVDAGEQIMHKTDSASITMQKDSTIVIKGKTHDSRQRQDKSEGLGRHRDEGEQYPANQALRGSEQASVAPVSEW
jgi:hypothetical protein